VIPLRDDVPSRSAPVVTVLLIAANAALWLFELTLSERGLLRFLKQAAVVPALYTGDDEALGLVEIFATTLQPDLGQRVLTSMFLHGGWLHFLGNMLYLWIFGDNVEDRLGRLRFLAFYLLCGWIAAYAHVWAEPVSGVPAIGASGAIAGVLGAYMLLYPRARVVAILPLGIVFPTVQVPALLLLGWWFVQQFLLGSFALAQGPQQGGGTAWWAHIGGFIAGALLVGVMQDRKRRPPAPRTPWWEDEEDFYGSRRRAARGRW
jgi:membrane associated rhomboid family serine protease